MKRLLLSLYLIPCLVTQALASGLTSTMVGGQFFYSSDTDSNIVTSVTVSDWLAAKDLGQGEPVYQSALQDWFSRGDTSIDTSGGKPLVRVSTRDSANPAGAFLVFDKPISMKDNSLRLRVKASNWKAITGFSIILASDGTKFADSITLDLRAHVINAADNEWVEVVAPIGDWIVDGNPDVSSLNALLWKVEDNGVEHVSTQIDDLAIVPNLTSAVSITIDDGLSSAAVGGRILRKYGMRGTICLDETALNTPGFLTQSQVDRFAKDGWDISGHQVLHNFRKSTDEELAAYLRATATYLKQHHYRGSNIFAYPNGIDEPRVNAEVARNFEYGMDIDGLSNTLAYLPKYRINRRSYDQYTTLDQLKAWIIDAQTNHQWLILNFHTFDPNANTNENIDPGEFESLVQFLKERHITVAPVSEMLKSSSSSEPINLNVTEVTKKAPEPADRPREFGASYSRIRYSNPTNVFNADAVSFLTNLHRGNYAVVGQLGVASLGSRTYFLGDTSAYYFTSPTFGWNANINGDIVDSPQGLAKGITETGIQLGFDYEPKPGGVSVLVKQWWYSDSNQRTGWFGKAYVNVAEGANLYVFTNQYHDNVVTSDYFSPNNYTRYGLGLGFRKRYSDYLVTGHVDDGRANADGESNPAYSWKLSLESALTHAWSPNVAIGSDRSNTNNYQYSYITVGLNHPF